MTSRLADFVASGMKAGLILGIPTFSYGLGRMRGAEINKDLPMFTKGAGIAMFGTGMIVTGPIVGALVSQTPKRPPFWPAYVGMIGMCYGLYHYGKDGCNNATH